MKGKIWTYGKTPLSAFCKKQFHGSTKCGNNATPVQKVQRQRWWKSICDALKVSLALITSPPLTVPGGWDCGADKPDIKLYAHGSDENFHDCICKKILYKTYLWSHLGTKILLLTRHIEHVWLFLSAALFGSQRRYLLHWQTHSGNQV